MTAALGALAAAARGAGAQAPAGEAPVALDVGVARIQQAGTAPLLAPSVGASWRGRGRRGGAGAAAVAAGGDGRVAAQLALDGARAFGPARSPFEVTAELRGVRVPNTPWAAALLAGARQHAAWGAGGVWVGAQGGVVRQVGEAWPSGTVEAGAWRPAGALGRVALAATAARARVEERGLVAAGVNAFGPVRVSTGELVASYVRTAGRLEASAWAGARAYAPAGLRALPPDGADSSARGAPLRWRAVAAASVTAWLRPSVGMTASVGALPNDPVRGLPAARHVVLALRVRPGARPPAARAPGAMGAELRVEAAPAGGPAPRVVRVLAPGARRVLLRADATGWRAVAMTPDGAAGGGGARGGAGGGARGGGWSAALALAPGTHRVLVQVDDGPWRPPANLPAVDDDLGGRVGLLVVP